ncbi:hypothetical protein AWENTII_005336 [Aspergillus wentii]|nr:hypothetical protein MW887_000727 [Aspergillus wentii]
MLLDTMSQLEQFTTDGEMTLLHHRNGGYFVTNKDVLKLVTTDRLSEELDRTEMAEVESGDLAELVNALPKERFLDEL